MANYVAYVNRIEQGNIWLIVCCVLYLIWWTVAFNPTRKAPMAPKVILFIFTLLAGCIGVLYLLQGSGVLPKTRGSISSLQLIIVGVVAYVVLLLLSYFLLHRQVTTELFLIVGWTILQLCVLNSLYRAEIMGSAPAIISSIIIVVAAIIGMLCYLAYYELESMKAFYDGMIPLILFAVVMIYEIIVIWFCMRSKI